MLKLLTEDEAATVLRCSVSKIRRLRRTKQLPSIPGRPVLIDEADLSFYVECRKRQATKADKSARSNDEIALRARQKAIRTLMGKMK